MKDIVLTRLALRLGGSIVDGHVETKVDGLRAVVSARHRARNKLCVDLAVFTPDTRELAVLDPSRIMGTAFLSSPPTLPRVGHGFVFLGCVSGVLYATSVAPFDLDGTCRALDVLAVWARKPWRAYRSLSAPPQPPRWLDRVEHASIALVVGAAATLLRFG